MLTIQEPAPLDVEAGPGDVAGVFIDALTARNFPAVRSVLAESVRMRMLVPGRLLSDEGADAVVSWFSSWFGDAEPFQVEASSAEEVEGRAAVTYRLRLRKPDGWYVIEQHLMLDVSADGHITVIDLLCSGFRPIAEPEPGPALVHHFDAGDFGCADGLAKRFRQEIQRIPIGHQLVVSTTDPAAKADLPSLARLMGHAVRSIEASGDGRLLINVERGK